MIGFLRGDVAQINESQITIDVGGVGYRVTIPTSVRAALSPGTRDATLHTSLVVTDDALSLYGFLTVEERDIFEILTTVSGIGPKVAVRLLSLPREQLVDAIASGDIALLTKIQGIGKKIAERICLELRDKLAGVSGGGPSLAQMGGRGELGAAMNGLTQLGFTNSEMRSMLKQFTDEKLNSLSAQEIITLCLKSRK